MKPDAFFPFYAADFWQAVEGFAEHIVVGYLRAITHYWCHEHCEGLRDDKEYLRKVCRIERDQWDEACAIIFDNEKFFTQDATGLWQQKRALELWREQVEKYEVARTRGFAGAKARWKTTKQKG